MVSRVLVTTADESTWPAGGPVLFLGEWCRVYSRRHVWEELDAELVPYHWDDRDQLYRDYLYLKGLHEELLRDLARTLNRLHGVRHSVRYWRILAGPWLGLFTQTLFDRWTMLQLAVSQFAVSGAHVRTRNDEALVPPDTIGLINAVSGDDWNEGIYGQLLRRFTNVPLSSAQGTPRPVAAPDSRAASHTDSSGLLRNASETVSRLLTREEDAFLYATYLPRSEEARLHLALGQLPKAWKSAEGSANRATVQPRDWEVAREGGAGAERTDTFGGIVRWMIPRHLASVFVEGYADLSRRVESLPWPRKPKLIFTSSADGSDEVLKAWIAKKTEIGSPLVVGQHGGNYGSAKWNFSEEHQIAISDRWLSWGWTDGGSKVVRAGNLKVARTDAKCDPLGGLLLVETIVPRYSYSLFSVPVAGQWLDYLDEQQAFVAALPDEVRRRLTVRLARTIPDYEWQAAERWRSAFPDATIDDGWSPIISNLRASRLSVSTSNTTTFLETLALNLPTVVFWNPGHWELRDEAKPYFEILRRAEIFFDDPRAAAAKVAQVWPSVPEWWTSADVQQARGEFCERFSRNVVNPVETLGALLEGVLTERRQSGSTAA